MRYKTVDVLVWFNIFMHSEWKTNKFNFDKEVFFLIFDTIASNNLFKNSRFLDVNIFIYINNL